MRSSTETKRVESHHGISENICERMAIVHPEAAPHDRQHRVNQAHSGALPILSAAAPAGAVPAGRPPVRVLDLGLFGHLQGVVDLDPRYRTVLSSLVCPNSSCTARRFFVRR
jgi:hypothetical protein